MHKQFDIEGEKIKEELRKSLITIKTLRDKLSEKETEVKDLEEAFQEKTKKVRILEADLMDLKKERENSFKGSPRNLVTSEIQKKNGFYDGKTDRLQQENLYLLEKQQLLERHLEQYKSKLSEKELIISNLIKEKSKISKRINKKK
jgi:hypothetical protein